MKPCDICGRSPELCVCPKTKEIEGYCRICEAPFYSRGNMVLEWGPYPRNPAIGAVVVGRRCRDEARCAINKSVKQ